MPDLVMQCGVYEVRPGCQCGRVVCMGGLWLAPCKRMGMQLLTWLCLRALLSICYPGPTAPTVVIAAHHDAASARASAGLPLHARPDERRSGVLGA